MMMDQPGYGDIEQLYRDYHQPITRHLMRLVDQRETAEDLCQEVFLKAMHAWSQHNPSASVRSWLYQIATNTAYDYLRRQRRAPVSALAYEQADPTYSIDDALACEPIQLALSALPAHYRVPLLHSMAGYSLASIAADLGIKVNTVKTRIFRAREQFRKHYTA